MPKALKRRREHSQQEHVSFSDRIHPRNYKLKNLDFRALAEADPELRPFLRRAPVGDTLVLDYANPQALYELTRATFRQVFGLTWHQPPGHLVPPLPGRGNYIHTVADFFLSAGRRSPQTPDDELVELGRLPLKLLDVGVGANCVYPLLASASYPGWHVVGTDIDPEAVTAARELVTENQLTDKIEIELQPDSNSYFNNIRQLQQDRFHLCICNPPFYADEASTQVNPKRRRVATPGELRVEGGDLQFILNMIQESQAIHEANNQRGKSAGPQTELVIGPAAPPQGETVDGPTQRPHTGRLATQIRSSEEEPLLATQPPPVAAETGRPSQGCWLYSSLVPRLESVKTLEAYLRSGFKVPFWQKHTLYQGKQTRWVLVWSWHPEEELRTVVEELHAIA